MPKGPEDVAFTQGVENDLRYKRAAVKKDTVRRLLKILAARDDDVARLFLEIQRLHTQAELLEKAKESSHTAAVNWRTKYHTLLDERRTQRD